jgi:F0F1-type ATP synthase membrane subunit b/b'
MNILDQLKAKEQKLAELRTKEARRKGQLDQLMQQLGQDFNVSTKEEANSMLTGMEVDIQNLEDALRKIDQEMAGIIAGATK